MLGEAYDQLFAGRKAKARWLIGVLGSSAPEGCLGFVVLNREFDKSWDPVEGLAKITEDHQILPVVECWVSTGVKSRNQFAD